MNIWNIETNTCTLKKVYRSGPIPLSVAFSPSGKVLAVGNGDGVVQLISLLNYDILRCVSLFLYVGVAPYVLLDIVNFCDAANNEQCVDEKATFLQFEKISFLEALQRNNRGSKNEFWHLPLHWANVCREIQRARL